jgi:hypothetical protein
VELQEATRQTFLMRLFGIGFNMFKVRLNQVRSSKKVLHLANL